MTLAKSCSPSLFLSVSACFHLSFSLQIYFRESEMGIIKMDEIPARKVTADGKLFSKER